MIVESVAAREHVIVCGFGRVGQNIARILDDEGFEYIALDLDTARVRRARQAGDTVFYGNAERPDILAAVGLATASAVVISFGESYSALKIVRAIREVRSDVPILVRTADDTYLQELEKSGATSIVPETLEASLILVSHVLSFLKVPEAKVHERIEGIREARYGALRSLFRKSDARPLDDTHSYREELQTLSLPPGAWAEGRTLKELGLDKADVVVTAIRRDGIVGRLPAGDTEVRAGDVLVLYGTPEALEHAESLLLAG
jgi:CPA2 family monovalent cation:H+ antiporter-2